MNMNLNDVEISITEPTPESPLEAVIGTNNINPPETDNQNKNTEIKEEECEYTVKQECILKEENESNGSEPDEANSDSDESSKDNEESSKDNDESSQDDAKSSKNYEDKSWPNIPVEAILKYENDSTDNDEDSLNNSYKTEIKSRVKCPLNCGSTFKGRQWAIKHLRNIHKMELSEAKKTFPSRNSTTKKKFSSKNYDPPNNYKDADTKSRINCPLNCDSSFKGRQWVIQHLRSIHKIDLLEAKKMVPKIKNFHRIKREKRVNDFDSTDNDEDSSNQLQLNCPLDCGSIFKGRQWVVQHLRHSHKMVLSEANKKVPYIKSEVRKKVPKIKSEKKVPCSQCHQLFLSEKRLDIHVTDYHAVGDYTCEKCGETFNLKGKFKKHIFLQHTQPITDEKVKCLQCQQLFLNQRRLDIHVDQYHLVGDYTCNTCCETFHLKGKLKGHVYAKHTKKIMISHLTNMATSEETPLQDTQPINSDLSEERPYSCGYCDKRFKDSLTLKRHTNVQHTREETHVCDHCGTVYYTKYELNTHLASKHGINDQFKCGKCNMYLMSEGSLIKHTSNCVTIPCPVCGKEFKSKSKMQSHVNGHLNNKRHMCDECGKDFLHARNLVDHIEIIHQGQRPYYCDSCPKTFTRKGSLRVHKLLHTGIKAFPCTLCEQFFTEKRRLITHLQKRHKIEDNEIQNYVKVMPKKEIVKEEDAERVLQAIREIKPELVQDVEMTREPQINLDSNHQIFTGNGHGDDFYADQKKSPIGLCSESEYGNVFN